VTKRPNIETLHKEHLATVPEFQPGIYQHYKGPTYLALGIARHSETGDRLVIYMPLQTHDGEEPTLHARPAYGPAGFFEQAGVPGEAPGTWHAVKRFTLLSTVNLSHYLSRKVDA